MREPRLAGPGETAREIGCLVDGRGGIARKFEAGLAAGAGDGDSRDSVEDRFIEA
jgi:hypothetical protein